jgi:hypothetical protein
VRLSADGIFETQPVGPSARQLGNFTASGFGGVPAMNALFIRFVTHCGGGRRYQLAFSAVNSSVALAS